MSRIRKKIRRRRTPDMARTELLDAADRVFQTAHPDHVGLKEVAKEAGTSHALITHYFGTYTGLVEATLARRVVALRERVAERLRTTDALERPEELLGMLFDTLEDPVHLRLVKFLVAGERPAAAHAFALQNRGLQLVAGQVAEALHPNADTSPRGLAARARFRETLELAMLAAVATAFGYAMCKDALVGGLGRDVSPELDASVKRTLAGMLQTYVRAALEELAAPPAP